MAVTNRLDMLPIDIYDHIFAIAEQLLQQERARAATLMQRVRRKYNLLRTLRNLRLYITTTPSFNLAASDDFDWD